MFCIRFRTSSAILSISWAICLQRFASVFSLFNGNDLVNRLFLCDGHASAETYIAIATIPLLMTSMLASVQLAAHFRLLPDPLGTATIWLE